MAAPRLPLDSAAVAAIGADPGRFQYRPVRVTGVWDETGRFLLRARGRLGAPGVHLVTPLLLPGVERALLVDRGWLPSPDAATADPRPFRQPGTVTISGTIELPPPPSQEGSLPVVVEVDGLEVPTYQRIDPGALDTLSSHPVLPFYVSRSAVAETDSGPPFGADPLELDEGPHLGYAIQWFSFAAIAIIGFFVAATRFGARP